MGAIEFAFLGLFIIYGVCQMNSFVTDFYSINERSEFRRIRLPRCIAKDFDLFTKVAVIFLVSRFLGVLSHLSQIGFKYLY